MTGTIINIIAVLIGGSLGLLFGSHLPDRLKKTIVAGLGLFTAVTGIKMFLETENSLIVLGALLIGALPFFLPHPVGQIHPGLIAVVCLCAMRDPGRRGVED